MNVLFITIDNVMSFETRSIYMDLVNTFIKEGHFVTVLSACEKRFYKPGMSLFFESDRGEVIKFISPNVTRVSNYIKKGLALIRLNYLYKEAAKKAMLKRTYDLVLYGSPPVNIYYAIELVKKKNNAYSYLLLKDIWPYDCVFGNVLSTKGWKGIAFNILKRMARRLYRVSDTIGCMSPANIKFLTDNEPELDIKKIEINPNSSMPFGNFLSQSEKNILKEKYGIPTNKIVFIYGGNLGTPQGIDFALDAVKASKVISDVCFVFVGGGTAKDLVEKANNSSDYSNLIFIPALPKNEYDQLVYACDVGLIFLNHDCLAPNYPSRLLSYMQAGLPILCATDVYTDIGTIAEENGYGLKCESNDKEAFVEKVQLLMDENRRRKMGIASRKYFDLNYTTKSSYDIIINRLNNDKK